MLEKVINKLILFSKSGINGGIFQRVINNVEPDLCESELL